MHIAKISSCTACLGSISHEFYRAEGLHKSAHVHEPPRHQERAQLEIIMPRFLARDRIKRVIGDLGEEAESNQDEAHEEALPGEGLLFRNVTAGYFVLVL